MNWYKEIKFAFPVVDDEKKRPWYIGIGHKSTCINILWFINDQWDLLTEESDCYLHQEWDKFIMNNIISHGRYDGKDHMASIIINADVDSVSFKYRYIINRTSKILDKAFNNPRIFVYK